MSTRGDNGDGARTGQSPRQTGEELVYVSPRPVYHGAGDDRISIREVLQIILRGKGIIIATTILFALGSVAYALTAKEVFRAEVLLVPAEEQSTPALGGQLGGLAALAGVATTSKSSVEPLAVLQSRQFARGFIEQLELMPVFFSESWDAENAAWLANDPADAPDIRDGVKYFHRAILEVTEDRSTGLVTVAVEWTDPDIAAEWAAVLVRRLNDRSRERALREAEANVAYLEAEMTKTTLFSLQESIGRLLESELQKLMLARGNEEFAFKVVDPPVSPKQRVRPKRALIAVVGTLLGGLLGVFIVLVGHAARTDDKP